jgi:hypothetical protein
MWTLLWDEYDKIDERKRRGWQKYFSIKWNKNKLNIRETKLSYNDIYLYIINKI